MHEDASPEDLLQCYQRCCRKLASEGFEEMPFPPGEFLKRVGRMTQEQRAAYGRVLHSILNNPLTQYFDWLAEIDPELETRFQAYLRHRGENHEEDI